MTTTDRIQLEPRAWLGAGLIQREPPPEALFGALPAGPCFSAVRARLLRYPNVRKGGRINRPPSMWWLEADSNRRPRDYETLALTT